MTLASKYTASFAESTEYSVQVLDNSVCMQLLSWLGAWSASGANGHMHQAASTSLRGSCPSVDMSASEDEWLQVVMLHAIALDQVPYVLDSS